jgi:biopolymer transport protein ExbB
VLELFTGMARQAWADGGWVTPPLTLCALALWYGLGWRAVTLRRGDRRELAALVAAFRRRPPSATRGVLDTAVARAVQIGGRERRPRLEQAVGELRAELSRGEVLVSSVVTVAPLLGLLGTVTGMIETFDSLATMALFSQSGGIAGGVAQALFTTQMGLAVAIPGLVIGRLQAARQRRLEGELDALVDLLSAEPVGGAA